MLSPYTIPFHSFLVRGILDNYPLTAITTYMIVDVRYAVSEYYNGHFFW